MIASTGGLPLSLANRIESDLRQLDKARIKPVFVFSGLPLAQRPPPKGPNPQMERENAVKNEAWAYYEDGQVDRAVVALTQIKGGIWVDTQDVVRLILRAFKHRQVEYVIAPYLSAAQVSVVERKEMYKRLMIALLSPSPPQGVHSRNLVRLRGTSLDR